MTSNVNEFATLYDEPAFQKQVEFLRPFLQLSQLREVVNLIAEVNPVSLEYDFSIDAFVHVLLRSEIGASRHHIDICWQSIGICVEYSKRRPEAELTAPWEGVGSDYF